MTIKALVWAMRQTLPPAQKLLMIYLAEWSDQFGDTRRPEEDMAEFCGVDAARIPSIIADLEDAGLIVRRQASVGPPDILIIRIRACSE